MIITSTISLPEILWTVFCFIGLLYSLRLFIRAVGSLKFLKLGGFNHTRSYSAITTIWVFASMTFSQFIYVLIGVFALAQPSPGNIIRPTTYAIFIAFVCSSAIMTIIAYIIEARKDQLIKMLLESDEFKDSQLGEALKERNGDKNITSS